VRGASLRRARGASATRGCGVALLLGLVLAHGARAYDPLTTLNAVARFYSLGVGEVRCPSPAEWRSDQHASLYLAYTNVSKDYSVLAPPLCEGASDVANRQLPAWQRALGTLALVHEAFHLRHWRFRREEAKVGCQAIVYFTDAAQRLGASEAEANNLYPYALAWHLRLLQLLPWHRDPACLIPPWIPPTARH
jgi:ribosomal protein L39E